MPDVDQETSAAPVALDDLVDLDGHTANAPSVGAHDDADLVSAAQLARLCGRCLRTLADWDKVGATHPVIRRGRRYYRLPEVLLAIANGTPGVNPRPGSIIKQLSIHNSRDT